MRALTPFLKTCLHASLSAPLEDVLSTRDRSSFGTMGPHIVLVSRLDPQTNAVLVNDGSHSMWAFLPPSSVQVGNETYPHIRSLKDFRGCVLRVEVCHFSMPRRHSSSSQSTTSLGRICLHVTNMEIIDVPSISPNESPSVLHDPSIASLVMDMPLARLEPRLLPEHTATFDHQPLHPHNRRYYHAYMFHEKRPLTLEDCIIPQDQWRLLGGVDLTDSELIAQNGSVSLPPPSSQSQAGSLPPSASSNPSSITVLPSRSSVPHDNEAPSGATAVVTTQASSGSSPSRPYAFCHQSLQDNFIADPDASSASSASSASPRHAAPPLPSPPRSKSSPILGKRTSDTPSNKASSTSSVGKENPPHAPRTTDAWTSNRNPRRPLGNTTNLTPSSKDALVEPHAALTRKSPMRTAALRRRTKSTASSSSSSSSKRSRFSSRYDWDDETKDDVASDTPSHRPRTTHDAPPPHTKPPSSTGSAVDPSADFTQWQTQQQTQPRFEASSPAATRRKRPRPSLDSNASYDDELMSVLDQSQPNTDDEDGAATASHKLDFFTAVHFRPSIRNGELHSIQVATVDCTSAVLEFIRSAHANRR